VMGELFRALCENDSARESQKATRFASICMHRQRLKQSLVVSGRCTEKKVQTFNDDFSASTDGSNGKAWKGGMRDRPHRMLLHRLSKSISPGEASFNRY